jgi:hypothetical protein
MTEISDLIDFENENSSLDFKAIQYKKGMYESFLKDIMSLANSISKDDKYIILGVKHQTNGERELLGINEQFVDDATYQQIVDSNIEPHIGFNYFPFEHQEKLFGIIKITDCSSPPYMMKKNNGNLKLGDSFIRKGSFQKRIARKDIDNYYENNLKEIDISSEIDISFNENEIIQLKEIEVLNFNLPSEITKNKIEKIITRKEQEIKDNTYQFNGLFPFRSLNINGTTPYEKRDISILREDLKSVNKTYKEKDSYYINETTAHKINFFVHNNSSKFLEDASIEVTIPYSEKFRILKSIYIKPYERNPILSVTPRAATWKELNYPIVERKGNIYRISEEIGNIKHKLPIGGFQVPFRLIISKEVKGLEIEITVKIFAKNIPNPVIKTLKINM